ncbi:MAG: asparagine synthase (glutamine-hydrolyzing) [Thermoanaerobaculia bacterium]|nr:asparagine synthase (glutamine-hydrolyzing) [Thermoanaerobaculia bacterium]
MCGICGVVGDRPRAESVIPRMTEQLRHRGPDDSGRSTSISGRAELGFRRLSIIDLAHGQQPMSSEDGRVLLVGNGEIYNFRSLQKELESRGHRFRSRCDMESVVHLYEERGAAALDALHGMFALALWDDREESLLLAVDRMGKKPLYYWHRDQLLVFASEAKAILEHPAVPRELEEESLHFYLAYHYVPAPRTLFRGIRRLEPGQWVRFRGGRLTSGRYWEPGVPQHPIGSAEAPERIRNALSAAVERRLVSDVPLGAFLSGGIDSSIVVGLMAQKMGEPVKTFSIGFDEGGYSETGYARRVARHFGTDHHEFVVHADAVEVLPKLVWHYDEPFADPSAVPTYYVSRETAGHVKVALSGDGGDETFGGYRRYSVMDRLAGLRRLPAPLAAARRSLDRLWARARSSKTEKLLRPLASRRSDPLAELYRQLVSRWPDELRRAALASSAEPGGVGELIREPFDRHRVEATTAAAFTDLVTYLPGDILRKVDVASMACSLEVRCPFLDPEVVDLAFRLPAKQRVRGRRRKIALRHAFRGLLPGEILTRGKRGFNVPLREWFLGPLAPLLEEIVLSRRARERGVLDAGVVEALVREHRAGVADRGSQLWALLCLELWFRTFLDRAEPGPVTL